MKQPRSQNDLHSQSTSNQYDKINQLTEKDSDKKAAMCPIYHVCVVYLQSLGIVSALDETELSPATSCDEVDTRYNSLRCGMYFWCTRSENVRNKWCILL